MCLSAKACKMISKYRKTHITLGLKWEFVADGENYAEENGLKLGLETAIGNKVGIWRRQWPTATRPASLDKKVGDVENAKDGMAGCAL